MESVSTPVEAGFAASWEFRTVNKDIAYSVHFEPRGGGGSAEVRLDSHRYQGCVMITLRVQVRPSERVDSHKSCIFGDYKPDVRAHGTLRA